MIIERSSNGLPLVQQLSREGPFRAISWPPTGIRQQDKAENSWPKPVRLRGGVSGCPPNWKASAASFQSFAPFPTVGMTTRWNSLTQVLEFIFWKWKSLIEQRDNLGRLQEKVRGKRPPLPALPEWIE